MSSLTATVAELAQALHGAIQTNNVALVRDLVQQEQQPAAPASTVIVPLVEVKLVYGETALHWACKTSCTLDMIRCLVDECRATVNVSSDFGVTPLHWACDRGQLDVVHFLVTKCGAQVTATNKCGRSPLHWAGLKGHVNVVRFLVTQPGVNVNSVDQDGETALHKASRCFGRLHHVLPANGANGANRPQPHELVQFLVQDCSAIVDAANHVGDTALHLAVVCQSHTSSSTNANTSSTHTLFPSSSRGAMPFGQLTDTTSIISATCSTQQSIDNLETVQFLVESCHANLDAVNQYGATVLHAACLGGTLETVQYLVDVVSSPATSVRRRVSSDAYTNMEQSYGHVTTLITKDGSTLLHYACYQGRLDIVQYLIEVVHGQSERAATAIVTPNAKGQSALDLARSKGHYWIVDYLLHRLQLAQSQAESEHSRLNVNTADDSNELRGPNYGSNASTGYSVRGRGSWTGDFIAVARHDQWRDDVSSISLSTRALTATSTTGTVTTAHETRSVLTSFQNDNPQCPLRDDERPPTNVSINSSMGGGQTTMPEVTVSAPTTVEVNRLLLQSLVETAKEIKTHVQDLAFNTNAHHAQQSVQQNAMRATIESTHTNLQGIAHTSSATHDEIQQTNRNLLPAIVNGLGDLDLHITNPIPRLFFVAKVDETKHPSSLLEKPRHLLQGTIAQRYHLYFVCAHSRLPVNAPINIYLTKPWADAAAPYLSAGLHVLQGALSVLGYQVNWAGLAFHLSEDAVREMLLEVASIVKTKGLRADSSTLLNNQLPIDLTNIPELHGDVYRYIVKQADTQRGWRELMEPVRTADNPASLWVLKEVANDPNNHYVKAH